MFPESFLTLDRIVPQSGAGSKKRILEEIGALLASAAPGLTSEQVFDKLLERERLGSTGLGQGIALPHARIEGVENACGALIRLQSGVDFDALDNHKVDIVFGLMVPQQATEEHLQLLAKLATLFSNEKFCSRLRETENGEGILDLINQCEGLAQSA
ncbi:MAG TPA: PTS sugar transporter subunit IIA [Gammaproteobacteria bacterium]|nr:PTS sugar transporter subunit IIA [Gammaproteobacteria bacterium]